MTTDQPAEPSKSVQLTLRIPRDIIERAQRRAEIERTSNPYGLSITRAEVLIASIRAGLDVLDKAANDTKPDALPEERAFAAAPVAHANLKAARAKRAHTAPKKRKPAVRKRRR